MDSISEDLTSPVPEIGGKTLLNHNVSGKFSKVKKKSFSLFLSCSTTQTKKISPLHRFALRFPSLIPFNDQARESVIIKVGEIISRFEKKGFKLIGLKMFQCPRQRGVLQSEDRNGGGIEGDRTGEARGKTESRGR
ncbi:uncharacterized protein LOC130494961 [Raphanus sativus]|uniref:Uncharacterized protein LOC130494961 n=1 Tax=Raphanus sativus TaxID=3726 RepID=A0A9W3BRF7_RAPSA|nr:uncharacterized protein LOC130494961 [Raphanus sativus]